jgi:hypothetical protein
MDYDFKNNGKKRLVQDYSNIPDVVLQRIIALVDNGDKITLIHCDFSIPVVTNLLREKVTNHYIHLYVI